MNNARTRLKLATARAPAPAFQPVAQVETAPAAVEPAERDRPVRRAYDNVSVLDRWAAQAAGGLAPHETIRTKLGMLNFSPLRLMQEDMYAQVRRAQSTERSTHE